MSGAPGKDKTSPGTVTLVYIGSFIVHNWNIGAFIISPQTLHVLIVIRLLNLKSEVSKHVLYL